MSVKNRYFAKNGHDCTIATGLEDLPMFKPSSNIIIQIKNIIIRFRMASELNYRCQTFLRSQKNVDLEHRKHELFWRRIRLIADCLCLLDVAMTFFTGYLDNKRHVVIMDPKAICINYLVTYFVPDFLSSIPTEYVAFTNMKRLELAVTILTYLSCLRLLRIVSFLRYCKQFCQAFKVSYITYKLSVIAIIYLLYFHVVCCLTIYIGTRNLKAEYHSSMYNESRKSMPYNLLFDVATTYFYSFYESSRVINSSGHLSIISDLQYYTSILWILSKLYFMYLASVVLDVILSKTSAIQKYFELVSELKDYMGHKRLPVHLQKRLLSYYEFRYEKTYFRENEILATISGQLKQEVVMHRCRKLVENVDFFKDLPMSLLLRIVASMHQEIFMTNDVIIKANTIGDCMFFIGSGTVAIYTKLGREICHLHDGDHFGEIALITNNDRRVASVVTVETSELYRLDRSDFLNSIIPYPDLLMKIQVIAQERMTVTKELEERLTIN
ncbi:hypothetical protein Trydic_g11427 [Trypoxylus dichotomus]